MSGYRSFTQGSQDSPSGQVLDTSSAAQWANATAYELAEILAAMKLSGTMHDFETLAGDLSRLAHRPKPWTKKYVHSVYHGHISPSPDFAATVNKLAQTVDGAPVGVAGAAWVRVLADPRQVPEGVLIPAGAVVMKCQRPGCPVLFVRTNPAQRYHDPECRPVRK